MNIELNSDAIYPGMLALEIGKYHNFLLGGYNLFSMDTTLFDDFLPFQFLPQILSNYDPNALRLIAFIIFLLVVIIFSLVIYKLSKNFTWALIFIALAVNMDPDSYRMFFAFPSFHIGTILFTGIFILLFLETDILNVNLKDVKKILIAFLLLILIDLVAFSDGIIVPFFVLPFVFVYVLFYRHKTKTSNFMLIVIIASLLATYIFSTYIINMFKIAHILSLPTALVGISKVITLNIPLYLKGLVIVYDFPLYQYIIGAESFGIIHLTIIISTIILLYFIIKSALRENNRELTVLRMFLISAAAFTFVPYVITGLCQNIWTSRYLTFTVLSLYVLIAISYRNKSKLFIAALIVLLVLNCYSNYLVVSKLDNNPNQNEYGLINFLESKNLSYGYGFHWESNIITYLSHENVTVRSAFITENGILPFRHLSNNNWYDYRPSEYFYIVNNNDSYPGQVNQSKLMISKYPPTNTYVYGSYTIYTFNRPDLLIQFN